MQADEKYMLDRANAIDGYDKDGKPRYTQPEHERQRLLRAAKGLRDSMVLQSWKFPSGQLPSATSTDQAAAALTIQAQSDRHEQMLKLAIEEVQMGKVDQLATLFMRNYKLGIG